MRLESFAGIRLPNQSARIMGAVIENAGLAWGPLLSKAGIPVDIAEAPDGLVSGEQELRLTELFVRATRHVPGSWFRMGLQYRLMGYGPLGLAVLAAGTFGAGLRVLTSFNALTYSLMTYRLVEEGEELIAIIADDTQIGPECREFSQERAIGAVTQILNDMHPALSPIARIETVLDASNGRHECADVLGIPVVFGAPVTQWILKPGVTKAPLPMASPLLEEAYGRLCKQLVEQARAGNQIIGKVYALLVHTAPQFLSVAEACKVLGLSERSLYRKLQAQGLTFGRMIDQVREQRATDLLANTRVPVEAVAEALGFAETASFSRAFKRWKGVPPLQYRKRGVAKPQSTSNVHRSDDAPPPVS